MLMLCTRTTSGMKKPKRSALASPAWGPEPVTIGPVNISSVAPATATRESVRSARSTRTSRAPGSWRARHTSVTAQATRICERMKWPATAAGCRSTRTVMPPSTICPTTPATSDTDHQTRSRR